MIFMLISSKGLVIKYMMPVFNNMQREIVLQQLSYRHINLLVKYYVFLLDDLLNVVSIIYNYIQFCTVNIL